MSIEKHPTREGWYYVKYYPQGRNHPPQRRRVEGFDAAYQLDQAIKQRKLKAEPVTHPRLEMIAEGYLEWAKKNLAGATYQTRERRMRNYILPFFGSYRVCDLNQQLLDRYAATVANCTYHTDLNALLALTTWMRKRDYCDPLHFKPERPRMNPRKQVFPTFERIIDAIESMDKPVHRVMFYMMLFSALRWNEIRNVRWENVSIKDGVYKLAETDIEDVLPIPAPVLPWLKENQKESGPVFEGRTKGQPYTYLWKIWKQAGEHIGLRISSHTFRRCAANHLYKMTGDIHLVQRLLRHKKVQTTLRYIEHSQEAHERGLNMLVDFANKSGKMRKVVQ